MAFCDPRLVRSYSDRRRIFNRMKNGEMPYRDAQRLMFIERVNQYKGLEFTAELYNAEFWEMINLPHSDDQNDLLILKLINKLGLSSGKYTYAILGQIYQLESQFGSLNLMNQSFEANPDDLVDYDEALRSLLQDHTYSLDSLAFIAALYRDALYYGRVNVALMLSINFGTKLGLICMRYDVDALLLKELVKISKENILTISPPNDSSLLERLKIQAEILNDPLNLHLKYFLMLHEKL